MFTETKYTVKIIFIQEVYNFKSQQYNFFFLFKHEQAFMVSHFVRWKNTDFQRSVLLFVKIMRIVAWSILMID